jgi:predicted CxxxxCH...CXXCH cytochrome family protein
MAWHVDDTSGTPVSARGSCVGGCHSDGRGGAPVKTPYWAGSSWTNSCGSCHSDRPKTGHHDHALDEGGTCASCHAGSSTNSYSVASHLNGRSDYVGTISGQGMTLTADASCASGVRCNGTCHGNDEGHNNKCW